MSGNSRLKLLVVVVIVAAAAQWGLLWLTDLPLGVPGEWTWARFRPEVGWWVSLAPALAAGGLLWGYVTVVAGTINRRSRLPRGALLGLAGFGLLWVLAAVSAVPGVGSLQRAPFVLYYERTSGYFLEAKYAAQDLPEFLATYQTRISDPANPANYLHQGTHPPGLTVCLWLLLRTCESSPSFTAAIQASQPADVREAFAVLVENEASAGRVVTQADVATLWLAFLLVATGSALTVIPLFHLAKRIVNVEAAWWTAALWLLVPACGVFLPKSDVLFALLSAGALALWLRALDRREIWTSAVVGAGMFVAINLSLAFAPLGLILLVMFATRGDWRTSRAAWKPVLVSGAVFLILLLACSWLGRINLLSVWRANLYNHAEFYQHFTRTWWKWLLEIPVETAFALGLPLALGTLIGLRRLLRENVAGRTELLICWLVWGLLWVSGKNRGEAARLWIFLFPIAVWTAGLAVEAWQRSSPTARRWLPLAFAAQLIACLASVTRVDGFHFTDFGSP